MSAIIKVENLSKQYRLGLVGASTFKEDSQRWWARIRGKEDPFLKHGVENERTLYSEHKFVWSLKDINFEVQQGDVLGVIGSNGAGKSTLLKILSKVTAPTTGSVKVKGRIASLLEVGTGFHPELTGRENIFLNGAILGMRKHEITRKLDEIIAFAGVEKYVDTPVKRYSSGMYVRLAFAVAAHLESEILIVDEVLAVGDIDFQKKCLGKMNDISQGEGRTVIFVSHNISSIQTLCSDGLLLSNGRNIFNGSSTETINKYLSHFNSGLITNVQFPSNLNDIQINSSCILNSKMVENATFNLGEKVFLKINYTLRKPLRGVNFCLVLKRNGVEIICSFDSDFYMDLINKLETGIFGYLIDLNTDILKAGNYSLSLDIGMIGIGIIEKHQDILTFCIKEFNEETSSKGYSESRVGFLYKKLKWEKE
jgi:lipopolysaccharide transport system ATP-binding protein